MMRLPSLVVLLCTVAAVTICRGAEEPRDAFHWHSLLGRGVNISCALEAPEEGQWGVVIEEAHFDLIKDAGFDSVRLPIRWNAHAEEEPPYAVAPEFLERVDQVVRWALDRELVLVLDWHHYTEFREEPLKHRERFLAIWEQLALHYQDWPPTLFFEVLNEPTARLTAELWNEYQHEAIAVIRKTNSHRAVVASPTQHSSARQLQTLRLPESDRNLIVTFHNYEPYRFTHQGVQPPGKPTNPRGVAWGSEKDRERTSALMAMAAEFGNAHNRPVWLGEFGTYYQVDMAQRVAWATHVRAEAEKRGIPWAYWSFCSEKFGLYDLQERKWRAELVDALIPEE